MSDVQYYLEKYEQLRKEYDNFSYIVSHDLQSPVRQISGFLEILLNELNVELNDEQKIYKELIDNALQEAEEKLDHLLEFSRFNTVEKNIEKIDVESLSQDILEDLNSDPSKTQITIGKLPHIYGDKNLIREALSFLYQNAFKFKTQDEDLRLDIGSVKKDDKLWIYIKDNGIGIKPEKIEYALGIFRYLHSPEKYPGKGIGLSYAKKIIEIHDGELEIISNIGEGTIIYLTLPTKDV